MSRAGTVAELQAQGWPVMARCLTCNLEMDVRLDVLLRERGPELSLWGRSQAGGKAVEMF